jgi:hypothetical protein
MLKNILTFLLFLFIFSISVSAIPDGNYFDEINATISTTTFNELVQMNYTNVTLSTANCTEGRLYMNTTLLGLGVDSSNTSAIAGQQWCSLFTTIPSPVTNQNISFVHNNNTQVQMIQNFSDIDYERFDNTAMFGTYNTTRWVEATSATFQQLNSGLNITPTGGIQGWGENMAGLKTTADIPIFGGTIMEATYNSTLVEGNALAVVSDTEQAYWRFVTGGSYFNFCYYGTDHCSDSLNTSSGLLNKWVSVRINFTSTTNAVGRQVDLQGGIISSGIERTTTNLTGSHILFGSDATGVNMLAGWWKKWTNSSQLANKTSGFNFTSSPSTPVYSQPISLSTLVSLHNVTIFPTIPYSSDQLNCTATPVGSYLSYNISFTWYRNGIANSTYDYMTNNSINGTATGTGLNVSGLVEGDKWRCSARAWNLTYSEWLNSSELTVSLFSFGNITNFYGYNFNNSANIANLSFNYSSTSNASIGFSIPKTWRIINATVNLTAYNNTFNATNLNYSPSNSVGWTSGSGSDYDGQPPYWGNPATYATLDNSGCATSSVTSNYSISPVINTSFSLFFIAQFAGTPKTPKVQAQNWKTGVNDIIWSCSGGTCLAGQNNWSVLDIDWKYIRGYGNGSTEGSAGGNNPIGLVQITHFPDGCSIIYLADQFINGTLGSLSKQPANLTLKILSNLINSFTQNNEFNNSQIANLNATQINNFLVSCTADANGNCTIPLDFHSDTQGIVQLNNLNLTYRLPIPTAVQGTATVGNPVNWSVASGGQGRGNCNYTDLPAEQQNITVATNTGAGVAITSNTSTSVLFSCDFDAFSFYTVNYSTPKVSQTGFIQDTASANQSNLTKQYIYNQINNTASVTYSNVQFTCSSGFTCLRSSPISSLVFNTPLNITATGDVLSETSLANYTQNTSLQTQANRTTYKKLALHVNSSSDISFTGINTSYYGFTGWTCLFSPTISVSNTNYTNESFSLCQANNTITATEKNVTFDTRFDNYLNTSSYPSNWTYFNSSQQFNNTNTINYSTVAWNISDWVTNADADYIQNYSYNNISTIQGNATTANITNATYRLKSEGGTDIIDINSGGIFEKHVQFNISSRVSGIKGRMNLSTSYTSYALRVYCYSDSRWKNTMLNIELQECFSNWTTALFNTSFASDYSYVNFTVPFYQSAQIFDASSSTASYVPPVASTGGGGGGGGSGGATIQFSLSPSTIIDTVPQFTRRTYKISISNDGDSEIEVSATIEEQYPFVKVQPVSVKIPSKTNKTVEVLITPTLTNSKGRVIFEAKDTKTGSLLKKDLTFDITISSASVASIFSFNTIKKDILLYFMISATLVVAGLALNKGNLPFSEEPVVNGFPSIAPPKFDKESKMAGLALMTIGALGIIGLLLIAFVL